MKNFFLFILLLLTSSFALAQGVTTSSMQGQVSDEGGESLIGVTITATHIPTGTFYGTVSDDLGFYRLDNMKVGGPYKVVISYVGQDDVVYENVYLRLGEPFRRDVAMGASAVALDEVVVTGKAGSAGKNSGSSTQISTEDIEAMPTLNRNLSDFTRLTPQASNLTSGTSFGGVNNRFNAIYVDGGVNNDVFGLANSGTNGGQTGIAPFSIDIIDQLQVVLSPYDVTYGGFAGGGINAVTKSGTNQFKGSAYYFMQNQSLVGETNNSLIERLGDDSEREAVADFTKQTYGLTLGGPIVKDKVFFFANAELQDDENPSPFNLGTYTSVSENRAQEADLNGLRSHLIDNFGYDPGTFGDVSSELLGVKLFGKLDFNLNKDHKLTLRHQYTRAEEFDRNSGNSSTINYSNNGIFFPSITNTTALELNSNFNNKMSNNLILGFTSVRDDRDPLGDPFPYVIIFDDAGGSIEFGSEQFSTANVLDQDIFTITNNFKMYQGKHTITLGTHNEFYSIRNVFMPWNFGEYEFASLDDFLNNEPAVGYTRVYSLVDDVAGDETANAADFSAMQLGLYAQDEIAISKNFTLTAGLRVDVPIITDDPANPPRFNEETLPTLLDSYPEFSDNVEAGVAPQGQIMLSPRVGFNYSIDQKSTLRGGVGIFTSRIPFVWPGAMFNTNGTSSTFLGEWGIPGDVIFRPDVQNQYTFEDPTIPQGDVNLFTKDFKYPQVFKTNLAYDTEFGDGWVTTLEASFTKTLNNIRYTNINTSNTVAETLTGSGDNRPVFENTELDTTAIGAVYLGSNTNEGYAYNLTAVIQKEILPNLNLMLAYNYGDSYALFEGTSSQNSSQWRGAVNINGRNQAEFGRSDFALGSKITSSLGYTVDWGKSGLATSFQIFYIGQSGLPFSYVIGGDRDARNLNGERGSTSRWRSLIYVPRDASDINLIDFQDGDNTVTAAEQWANLDAFINDDPHLSDRRGQYAEKNMGRAPWVNFIDLAIKQDFSINAGGSNHRFQASFDVFNLANLINSNWGVRYNIPGDFNNYELLNFEGFAADGTTPEYTYRQDQLGEDTYDISDFTSRWQARVGLRYIFN